ncbi:MAG: type II toxin-antitoxin system prevent-host-death family antitoxin [Propionibacterium sp.]|nr:type II toxin-antitoxin system prevent-host-death family antitoxin [Propionibacterium sp.]
MSIQINVADAKARLSELLTRVERGEQITLARAGRPIATLNPVESRPKRILGQHPEFAIPRDELLAPMSEAELAEWE